MKKKIILSSLFIIVISLLTIIVVILIQGKKDIKPIVNLTDKQLPAKNLPAELIKNSVIDNLFANTEGYVLEKYDEYFVLSDNNSNTINLYVEEEMNVTNFYRDNSSESNHILYSDIKVGDHLSGGVSIVPNTSGAREFINRKVGDIIAHTMIVLP
jgi:hypothetical protein